MPAAAVSDSKAHKFNPNFTAQVLAATGPNVNPRVKQLTHSLIQHLHDFARENELTVDEWMMGVELVQSPLIVYYSLTDSYFDR
jgi:catechol 1,2-dioxygenase